MNVLESDVARVSREELPDLAWREREENSFFTENGWELRTGTGGLLNRSWVQVWVRQAGLVASETAIPFFREIDRQGRWTHQQKGRDLECGDLDSKTPESWLREALRAARAFQLERSP